MTSAVNLLFPYAVTTRDVTVRVAVSFLPEQSDPAAGRWFWTYHVRLENGGDQPVRLISRHWIIVDARGGQNEVRGAGVVGEQPVIAPGETFDYVSGCPLSTATGYMSGSYRMVLDDGTAFDAIIPRFSLVGPLVTP